MAPSTRADALAAAAVLTAYGFGIMPIVLIRSAVASFQSIGDTRTPMLISLFAVAVNVGLKLLLFHPFGAAGLAAATATGAWINLLLLMAIASRQGLMRLDWVFGKSAAVTSIACFALALFALDRGVAGGGILAPPAALPERERIDPAAYRWRSRLCAGTRGGALSRQACG